MQSSDSANYYILRYFLFLSMKSIDRQESKFREHTTKTRKIKQFYETDFDLFY